MSIQKVSDSTTQLVMLQMMQQIGATINGAVSQANTKEGSPLGVSADFTKPSELLSKLSQLQQTDPAKFKSLMSDIATSLQKASNDTAASNGEESKVFTALAARFQKAADTGDLSQLQPAQKAAKSGSAGQAGGAGAAKASNSTCVVCGAAIPDGATVCPKCGMPVQDANPLMNIGNTGKSKIEATLAGVIGQANQANGSPLGDISGLSLPDVINKLAQLQQSDPDKFKTLMSAIADGLKKASDGLLASNTATSASNATAASAGGTTAAPENGNVSMESKMLAGLSARFENAAETGDLSQLQPPQRPPMSLAAMQAQIAQYLSDASSGNQESLLDMLMQKTGGTASGASGAGASSTLSSIRDIMANAMQQLKQDKAT